MLKKEDCIVISNIKFGDTSKILKVFSAESGIYTLLAKGAYRPKSKFGAGLEPITYSTFHFNAKAHGKLQILTDANIIEAHNSIKLSYDKTMIAMGMLETVEELMHEGQHNEKLFEYLKNALYALKMSNSNFDLLFVRFLYRAASAVGYQPDFAKISQAIFQNNSICYYCLEDNEFLLGKPTIKNNCIRINSTTLLILKNVLQSSLKQLDEIENNSIAFSDTYRFFSLYFSHHLEKNFNLKSINLLLK